MIKEITRKVKEVVTNVKIMDDIYCDICKKRIGTITANNNKKYLEQHYFHACTGHNDWGNDSVDSIETYEICSEICLCDFFDNHYLKACKSSNTQYLEINQVNKNTELPDDIVEKILNGEEIK